MAYIVIIETQRLILRTFTLDDAQLIYDLNIDPEVTRYTHDALRDINHARETLDKTILPQYALYNYGRWAVHIKPHLEFIGWCGLKYRAELNENDLGFRFKRSCWGKGYATEAAFASIKHGFEQLNLNLIMGRAEPENVGSWKVLEKCGMSYIGMQKVDGFPVKTYEIRNPLNH